MHPLVIEGLCKRLQRDLKERNGGEEKSRTCRELLMVIAVAVRELVEAFDAVEHTVVIERDLSGQTAAHIQIIQSQEQKHLHSALCDHDGEKLERDCWQVLT